MTTGPEGRFLMSLTRHHDKSKFEFFGYSDHHSEDTLPKKHFPGPIRSIDDRNVEQCVKLIVADKIDLLIDFCGVLRSKCLCIVAHRPAPVIGYYPMAPPAPSLTR
jgi:predicted O-linked N-acetylglucosamine transferase (SPINDLY family)